VNHQYWYQRIRGLGVMEERRLFSLLVREIAEFLSKDSVEVTGYLSGGQDL